MSVDYVTLLRFERGEISEAEAARVRAQLARDPVVRVDLDWIVALRTATLRGALEGGRVGPAPSPDDVAALAEGTLGAERGIEVRAQLAACEDGYGMLRAALEELSVARQEQGESAPHAMQRRPRAWGTRRQLLAAAAAMALSALAWRLVPRGHGDEVDVPPGSIERALALVDRTPLPVPTLRSGPLFSGLSAYESEAYPDAIRELRAAVEESPALGEAWLYLGSAYLIVERDDDALSALLTALEACTGSYANEARWQLAQARLATGDLEGARSLLRETTTGRHVADARDLLGEL